VSFLAYLERAYADRFGWKLSVERAPQGMRISASIERSSITRIAPVLGDLLWRRLKKDAEAVSYGIEMNIQSYRWWWTVADPVSAIQVLASFVDVTCSGAEARLIWIGL